jgi:hypothetical protein
LLLTITGRNPSIQKKLIKQAVDFALPKLLSPAVLKKLKIAIIIKELDDYTGGCDVIKSRKGNPRSFQIVVDRDISKKAFLESLFHELVHIKQYALGEMKDKSVKPNYGDRVSYRGKYYQNDESSPKDEDLYWDSPWEIEAYGREYGLYWRFKKHLKKLDIQDHRQ